MGAAASSNVRERAPSRAHWLGAFAAVAALALAGCASTPPPRTEPGPGTVVSGPTPQVARTKDGLTPGFMAGRPIVRLGMLLPFGAQPQDSESLYNAAELALFEHGDANTLLIPRDAGAAAGDAESAARTLGRDGADIILGPLTRDTVAGAGRGARVPVIAFSTDANVAGNGVYLLNYAMEEEVARVVDFAVKRGIRSIALLAPDTEYGRRVEQRLRAELTARQGVVSVARFYSRAAGQVSVVAQSLAAEANAAGAQAVMIADGGASLRAAAPALLTGGLDLRRVRLLGTGLWSGPEIAREPTLAGGWFAAPEPAARADFDNRYRAAYGRAPSRLAGLAYDAVALSALMARQAGGGEGLTRAAIERPQGFIGVDGVFRFRPDGTIERGLAVLEVRPGGAVVVDAAPKRFTAQGS
jgi:hypothetical protein